MVKSIERVAVILLLFAAVVGSLYAFYVYSRPASLKIAVGPAGGDERAILTGLSLHLINARAKIHLTVVPCDGPIDAAKSLERGEVDLAVIRGDLSVPSSARAIAILNKSAVIVLASSQKKIADFGDLKNKKLGIVGSPGANDRLISSLSSHYGLTDTDIKRTPLTRDEAVEGFRKGQIDAVLTATPLTGKTIANLNAAIVRALRGVPLIVKIDAEAIAKSAREYESEEIPQGTFRSSPAIPPDDISTLFVANYIVARNSLSEDTAAALTRLIFEARQPLAREYSAASLIEVASTDKDALVPIHPGAAAYYDDSEKTFFDRHGDLLFYGPMFLSLIGTAGLAVFRYLGRHQPTSISTSLERLKQLTGEIEHTTQISALAEAKSEVDRIFENVVDGLVLRKVSETDASATLLILSYVNDALVEKRNALRQHEPQSNN